MNRRYSRLVNLFKSDRIFVLALFLFMMIIITTVSSLLIDFQPTIEFETNLFVISAIIYFFVFLFARVFKFSLGGVFLSMIISVACSYKTTSTTLPAFEHYFTSKTSEIRLTVKKKYNTHSRGKCNPRVSFREITAPLLGYICVNRSIYNKLHRGQQICVSGNVSSVGISGVDGFTYFRNCTTNQNQRGHPLDETCQ